jgi:hypothetical protein
VGRQSGSTWFEERRIWADHELKPWKVEMFKVSNEPHFEEKLADVVGLHLRPPARATVLSFGEKTWERPLPARIVHGCGDARPRRRGACRQRDRSCSRHSENWPAGEGLSPP